MSRAARRPDSLANKGPVAFSLVSIVVVRPLAPSRRGLVEPERRVLSPEVDEEVDPVSILARSLAMWQVETWVGVCSLKETIRALKEGFPFPDGRRETRILGIEAETKGPPATEPPEEDPGDAESIRGTEPVEDVVSHYLPVRIWRVVERATV